MPLTMPSTLDSQGEIHPRRKLSYSGTFLNTISAAKKPMTTVSPAEIQVARFSSRDGLSPIFRTDA